MKYNICNVYVKLCPGKKFGYKLFMYASNIHINDLNFVFDLKSLNSSNFIRNL